MDAICGGNHKGIKTRNEWNEHFNKALDDGSCLDCWSGIIPKFNGDVIIGWHQI